MNKKTENLDKEKVNTRKMVEKIKDEAKGNFSLALKDKMENVTNYILDMFDKKGTEKVSNIQIMGAIAKNSLLNIAVGGGTSYSSQEILAGFNLYLEYIGYIW